MFFLVTEWSFLFFMFQIEAICVDQNTLKITLSTPLVYLREWSSRNQEVCPISRLEKRKMLLIWREKCVLSESLTTEIFIHVSK